MRRTSRCRTRTGVSDETWNFRQRYTQIGSGNGRWASREEALVVALRDWVSTTNEDLMSEGDVSLWDKHGSPLQDVKVLSSRESRELIEEGAWGTVNLVYELSLIHI